MKASYRKQGDTDMKKLYKKIGVILALTMVIGLIPAQGVNAAKAKSNVTYSIKKGTLVTVSYTHLTLPTIRLV